MKKIILLFIFCTVTTISFAQDDVESNEKDRRFSIGLVGGPYIQQLEHNDRHLTNETAYSAGLWLDYQIRNFFFVKTGVEKVNPISFSGLSYESYQIPLLIGSDLSFGKSNNSNIKLQGEFGIYYRIISDFEEPIVFDYQVNNVFGFQASFGIKYDVSDTMFAIVSLRNSQDFNDILEADDSSIRIKSGSALEIGFGYKF